MFHDLEQMYLDSFLRIAKLEEDGADIEGCIEQLETIGRMFDITFVLSISKDKEELPESLHDKVIIAL